MLAEQRKALGLDHPLVVQWWNWFNGFRARRHGDEQPDPRSVSSMIRSDLWPSLQLMFWATIVAVIVALLLSVYSAVKQYSVGDYVFTGLAYVGIAMPAFWFALMAIGLLVTAPVKWFNLDGPIVYSIGLHSEGMSGINLDYFRHLALPVLTLTVTSIAEWSRFGRASMLDVLNADYVRTSRAKGVPRRKVVFKHALRNALIPLRDGDGARHRVSHRRRDHHRADLLDLGDGPRVPQRVGRRRRAISARVVRDRARSR